MVVYLQRGAHNEEQVCFGEVFCVQRILLRKILSKKHNIRFHCCGTECAYGDVVIHYSLLWNKHIQELQQGTTKKVWLGFDHRARLTLASSGG